MARSRASIAGLVLLAALGLQACSESECACDPQPDGGAAPDAGEQADAAAVDGEQVFEQPAPDGNAFACASCHALREPAADGLHRVGVELGTAARRPSFHAGAIGSLHEAVNVCLTEWMMAAPLSADDPRWLGLEAYLEAQAGDEAAAAEWITIAAVPAQLDVGDFTRGGEVFSRTCAACHGPDARGTLLAPALAGQHFTSEFVATRVRTGGPRDSAVYEGLSGSWMPFWAAERLTDAELLDVVAFVTTGAGSAP